MKKTVIFTLMTHLFFSPTGFSASPQSQTFSLGYSNLYYHGNSLTGLNFNYDYQIDNHWGVLTSISWNKGVKHRYSYNNFHQLVKHKVNINYLSLQAGPSYRFNDYLTLYSTLGFARFTLKNTEKLVIENIVIDSMEHHTGLSWGAGIKINPLKMLSLYLSYEGANRHNYHTNPTVNGFNIGLGYRF
ncbi:Ail/Lom family outer membrane beta-barrel protein [Arsenophonus nasoniae]|uniref:Ail/Lom family outer membrane beta-barrel protein n=1 Tax=Arsenophonus nasoniae TaxID=638 RepID=D2TZ95_9GAMM|nr:Ail/Lom family outer membrane beta-barrel protein [Arsenophonus nasoniae]QBY43453.1 Attachment invasion locus protein [Arsenophonus nasoniae]WGM07432.1 Ail/Lom family outer membrane beta-barrel protein [Arsenophonus nasoniae]WGM12304.1 Ail/Lom family outer membrane beta-barrel protein [Arsenophonus nasoniae]WGM16984.1 Ail/Lom family outer membrane beta-barrel protein [Arsenophonus nasoniae]CBA72909.1 outer membrane protein [Arsenophonus nasoniae]